MADNTKNNESFLPGFEEPPPRIVHCKKAKYDIYIGRPGPFGNPFVVGKDGTRDEVIEKYEEYVRSSPELMGKIRKEIPGKVLGCWCVPKRCHGEILIKIADEGLALEKNQQLKEAEADVEKPLSNPEKPETYVSETCRSGYLTKTSQEYLDKAEMLIFSIDSQREPVPEPPTPPDRPCPP